MFSMLNTAVDKYKQWPQRTDGDGGYVNESMKGINMRLTCGCCQTICSADKKSRAETYRLLKNSGCVIQLESGDVVALPPEEAAKEFEKMALEHKQLYAE